MIIWYLRVLIKPGGAVYEIFENENPLDVAAEAVEALEGLVWTLQSNLEKLPGRSSWGC